MNPLIPRFAKLAAVDAKVSFFPPIIGCRKNLSVPLDRR
jgi:hypothetical protein